MRYFTPEEYARMMRVNPATVRRNARSLGGIKVGTQWRIPVEESKIATAEPWSVPEMRKAASVSSGNANFPAAFNSNSSTVHAQYAAILDRVRRRRAKR